MAQTRGKTSDVGMVVLLGVFLLCSVSNAATWTVGDDQGWRISNMQDWATGKTFKAGDTLVFKYNSQFHDVAVVDKAGHDSCSAPSGARVFKTGNDQITLAKGQSFFLCTVGSHCQSGQKLAITAV